MKAKSQLPGMDDEGCRVAPGAWSEELAAALARQENIELGEARRVAICFIRDFYREHRAIPAVRFVTRHPVERLGGSRNLIFAPLPYGCVNQACRIAAMRRPRGWNTAWESSGRNPLHRRRRQANLRQRAGEAGVHERQVRRGELVKPGKHPPGRGDDGADERQYAESGICLHLHVFRDEKMEISRRFGRARQGAPPSSECT